MWQENKKVGLFRNDQTSIEVLRIPYKGNIGLYIILDRKAKTQEKAYDSLVGNNVLKDLIKFKEKLWFPSREVEIFVPKFENGSTFDIKRIYR